MKLPALLATVLTSASLLGMTQVVAIAQSTDQSLTEQTGEVQSEPTRITLSNSIYASTCHNYWLSPTSRELSLPPLIMSDWSCETTTSLRKTDGSFISETTRHRTDTAALMVRVARANQQNLRACISNWYQIQNNETTCF